MKTVVISFWCMLLTVSSSFAQLNTTGKSKIVLFDNQVIHAGSLKLYDDYVSYKDLSTGKSAEVGLSGYVKSVLVNNGNRGAKMAFTVGATGLLAGSYLASIKTMKVSGIHVYQDFVFSPVQMVGVTLATSAVSALLGYVIGASIEKPYHLVYYLDDWKSDKYGPKK